jgi:hypothetical protein
MANHLPSIHEALGSISGAENQPTKQTNKHKNWGPKKKDICVNIEGKK